MSEPIRDRLQSSLKTAMRARDAHATSVLRTTLSAIANAEAVEVPAGNKDTEVPRKVLSEADVVAVVRSEHDDLASTAVQLRALGRLDEAAVLGAKAAVLQTHLGNG